MSSDVVVSFAAKMSEVLIGAIVSQVTRLPLPGAWCQRMSVEAFVRRDA